MKKTIYSLMLFLVFTITQAFAQQWEPIGPDNGKITYNEALLYMNGDSIHFLNLAVGTDNVPYILYINNGFKPAVKKFDGISWIDVGSQIDEGSPICYYLHLAVSPLNIPYVAFLDSFGWVGSNKIFVKKFDGNSWVEVGVFAGGTHPCITFDAFGALYLAKINNSLNVSMLKNDSWQHLGSVGDVGSIYYDHSLPYSITTNSTGTPFIVFRNSNNSNMPTVAKYDGSNWVKVGESWEAWDNSNGWPINFSIVIDQSDTPYVSYDGGYIKNEKSIIKKFDGTSWVNVGNNSISSGYAKYTSFAIDGFGTPYVAFINTQNNSKISVKRFDGNSWADVNSASLPTDATNTNLKIDSENNLILVYQQNNWFYAKKFNTQALSVDDYTDNDRDLFMYPNPVSDKLKIESNIALTKIEIYSILGQKVAVINADFNTISTENLSSGIYLVRAYSKKGNSVKKLIKN